MSNIISRSPGGAFVCVSLGDALRAAFNMPGVTQVKRCIGYGGFWYVYV